MAVGKILKVETFMIDLQGSYVCDNIHTLQKCKSKFVTWSNGGDMILTWPAYLKMWDMPKIILIFVLSIVKYKELWKYRVLKYF